MKKNVFIKSTIILIIGGFFTKLLGMIIKIIITRLIGEEGIGLYTIITPTFMLLITFAGLGFPVAISKIVSEGKNNNKKIILNTITASLFINLFIIILVIFCSGFIANKLLHEPKSYYALLSMGLVLPFISISSILRGYFFGKQRMMPHVITNIAEDIVRLILIIIGIPIFLNMGIEYTIAFLIITNIFSELTSIIIFLILLPKKIDLSKKYFIPEKESLKSVFSISLPTTGSRLIGNLGHFLEPIIITTLLLKNGYTNSFIINEYGIINGYVLPLILLPSFFTMAISQALLPVVSRNYVNQKYEYVKKKIKQACFFSLIIGIPATILFEIFPSFFLKTIFNTNKGVFYLQILAPIFLLYYIQTPITSSLQAIGKANISMKGTLFGMILKLLVLIFLCCFKIGLWPLIISISINIIFVTIYDIKKLRLHL